MAVLRFEARALEGEHDCCLGFPLQPATTEDVLTLGAPGLSLEAEAGLCGNDVLKFGGASCENPGILEDFEGLGFTVGELPHDETGVFELVGRNFDAEEDRPGGADMADALDELS